MYDRVAYTVGKHCSIIPSIIRKYFTSTSQVLQKRQKYFKHTWGVLQTYFKSNVTIRDNHNAFEEHYFQNM